MHPHRVTHRGRLYLYLSGLILTLMVIAGSNGGGGSKTTGPRCGAGATDCNGDGLYCCPSPTTSCCWRAGTCCNPGYPHHCPNGYCYKYWNQAQEACGNAWEVCGAPVGSLPRALHMFVNLVEEKVVRFLGLPVVAAVESKACQAQRDAVVRIEHALLSDRL